MSFRSALRAQDVGPSFALVPSVQYEWGNAGGDIPVFAGSSECGLFGASTTGLYGFSIGGEWRNILAPRFGFGVRLGYRWGTELYTFDAEPLLILDPDSAQYLRIPHEYRLEIPRRDIVMDAVARYRVFPWLVLSGGPSAIIRLADRNTQTDVITDPLYRLPTGEIEQPLPKRGDLTSRRFGPGLVGGSAISISLGRAVSAELDIHGRLDFSSSFEGGRQIGYSGGIGLSIPLHFSSGEREENIPLVIHSPDTLPTSIENPVTIARIGPSQSVTASIRAYGIDTEGDALDTVSMTIYQVDYERTIEPITAIEFKPRSTEFRQQATSSDIRMLQALTLDSITMPGLVEQGLRELDLIGLRMRGDTSMRLELARGNGMSAGLAAQRVEAVKGYLYRIWNILPNRIQLRAEAIGNNERISKEVGKEALRIVGDGRIASGLTIRRLAKHLAPPTIALEPDFHADAGVQSWRVDFLVNGDTVGEYISTTGDTTPQLRWKIDEESERSAVGVMVVRLTVTDSLGGTAVAVDSVPLRIERRTRSVRLNTSRNGKDDKAVFTPFGSSCEPPATKEEEGRMLREIVTIASDGDRVRVLTTTATTACDHSTIRTRAEEIATALRDLGHRMGKRISVRVEGPCRSEMRLCDWGRNHSRSSCCRT